MKISPVAIYNWYRQTLRNPKYRWWIIIGTIVYLVTPLDISPDFIPIVGQIDDFILVSLLVSELSSLALDSYKARTVAKPPTNGEAEGETIDVKTSPID